MRKGNLWRGLSTTTAVLLVISLILGSIADSRADFLNQRLGTTNYKIMNIDADDAGDGIYYESEFSSLAELVAAQKEIAAQISAEGSVLLKNDGALPLNKDSETVTLWGLNSRTPILGGNVGSTAAANVEAGQIAYGPREALTEKGFTLNTTMNTFYDSPQLDAYRMSSEFFGMPVFGHALSPAFWMMPINPMSYNVGEAPASLYTNDVLTSADGTAAVVVISRDNSEAADYHPGMFSAVESDSFERPLALSENEKAMIELAKAHSTKVIVLLNCDNPVEIEGLKQDDGINSILWVGAPGINGFLGVADVLSGAVAPSGHLSDTYAVSSVSAPAMVNYGLHGYINNSVFGGDSADLTEGNTGDWYLVESEGIYTGYKYYETRYEDQILGQGNAGAPNGSTSGSSWNYADEMSYPFGYGISYTTFEQKLERVDLTVGGTGTAVITVKNTGSVAAKSVVQLYVQTPYTAGGIEKSAIQLLDFAKTDVLQPDQSVQVTIEFDPQYIASYDETAVKANGTQGAWVLEAGDYYFAIGNGAHEALNNVLANKLGSTDGLIAITDDETINGENAIKWTLGATDIETYSVNVQNALQDCDLNYFIENAVEYTTRADWTKGWTPVDGIAATDEMLVGLRNQTYSLSANGEGLQWGVNNGLKLIDFVVVDDEGNYAGVIPMDDARWDQLIAQMSIDEAITFVENTAKQSVPSIGYITGMVNDGPLGFAFDQVAGYYLNWQPESSNEPTYVSEKDEYANYSMAVMPTEPVVAATFNKELVEREGEIFGETGLWANITIIMAPGLNLDRAVYCARNHEYYSEDPMLTNLLGVAVCKGGNSKGLQMEPKHLAFNHQELNRFGLCTFFNEQAGRENELRAFQGSLQSNYAAGLMSAFNRHGTVWAGADEGVQVQIVRNEWGYEGWITTDMVSFPNVMNWKDGVYGGSSTMLGDANAYADSEFGNMEANKDLILSDTEFQLKMREGIKYTLYACAKGAHMNGTLASTTAVYVRTWWQNTFLGVQIGTGVLTVAFAALGIVSVLKKKQDQ